MAYRVEIMPRAGREMKKLPLPVRKRVDEAILRLAGDPRPSGCRKLEAEGNAWRVRVGDYRVLYEIHDEVLLVRVVRAAHRSYVYQ